MKAASPLTLDELLKDLPENYTNADREVVQRAYRLAERAHTGQKRASGEPYINHCLAVAAILSDLHMPADVVAAGLLHDTVEDTPVTLNDLQRDFGDSIAKLVDGVTKLTQLPRVSRGEHSEELKTELSAAEVQLVNEVAREQVLDRALRKVEDEYDVILIDCQPSLGLLTVNALTAAHGVIIPSICEFFALRAVALLVETIEKVQDRINPRLQIDGVLATMYDARTLHSREVISRLVEAFGDKVFETVIKRTIKFADATVAAEPITSYAGNHQGAEAYRRLAKELVARGGAP